MESLLLIEDERRVAAFIRQGLEEEGYLVEWIERGQEGADSAIRNAPDLVLLDLRLPDIDGVEVCRRIRKAHPSLPILMLTALDSVEDRVAGLDAGADDYVAKPFAFAELLARIRSLLRRASLEPPMRTLTDGALQLERDARVCRIGEQAVDLTPTEFDLLAYLLSRRGQAVHRDDILDAVWGRNETPIPNAVDVYVGYLRRKLAAVGVPNRIESVRGIGYRYSPEQIQP
ncbi:MAG: response regulator transcription factor [Rhodothermales bacterium]